ncbi:hypothetical protein HDV00_008131 [Rhizophlyctis rosea]|nr:hypothetical protein HDV00_008131 [Rhizophlyctis rosea]
MVIDKMEREGRSVEQCAGKWHDIWREAVYAYNVHLSRVTGLSPYQMVFGQEPLLPVDEVTSDIAKELRERPMEDLPILSYLREFAAENRRKQHEAAARREEERGVPEPRKYQPGDKVWIYDARAANTFALQHKILPRWEGPVVMNCPANSYPDHQTSLTVAKLPCDNETFRIQSPLAST